MKRGGLYLLTVFFLGWALASSCGGNGAGSGRNVATDTTGTAVIVFNELEHNFGSIEAGEKVGCIFSFTNTGDADLILTAASASCGCTVPKYEKKPVAPGGKGAIEVVFDSSGRSGLQSKTVVVQSNAENNLIILRIIAEIKSE
jgi:hypothetical protein